MFLTVEATVPGKKIILIRPGAVQSKGNHAPGQSLLQNRQRVRLKLKHIYLVVQRFKRKFGPGHLQRDRAAAPATCRQRLGSARPGSLIPKRPHI